MIKFCYITLPGSTMAFHDHLHCRCIDEHDFREPIKQFSHVICLQITNFNIILIQRRRRHLYLVGGAGGLA